MLNRLVLIFALASIVGCARTGGSTDGTDAGDGTEAADATDGTDGIDGINVSDATDGTDATDGNDGNDGADGGPVDNPPEVVACTLPTPAAPPGPEGCAVEAGSTSIALYGDVLTPTHVYTGGAVVVGADGRITCVGCDCAADGATRVICPDAVISPGLINAHDHLGWMNATPWYAADEGVDPALRWEHRHDWRKGKRGNPKITTSGGSASKNEKTFREVGFALGGATAVFGSGDTGGVLRDLDKTGGGDNGLGRDGAEYQTFPLGDSGGSYKTTDCGYDPVSGESGHFVPHVSEGIDPEARNEFVCLTGQGPGSVDILNERSAIIHGVGLAAKDVALMADRRIGLVWSPRSNVALYGETARVTLMHAMGVTIGLGTDWVPSGSITVLRELQCADYLNSNHFGGYFRDDHLWEMVTSGAATTMGLGDVLGLLAPGYVADIAIFAKAGRTSYRAVIDATVAETLLVLRDGKPVVGESAVVDALGAGCDSLGDVCGRTKSVCATRLTGQAWSAVSADVTPAYPLFFCGVPDKEPSCVPTRTLPEDSIAGSGLYGETSADDGDGDGVPNATDSCPAIFNPIRPLDAGVQADADADLVGDECDPCPLDKDTTVCTKADPSDPDKDGVAIPGDNCPTVPNTDQADKDGDLKGDACDDCADYSNPGAAGCLATIQDVKTITAFQERVVAIQDVTVGGVAYNGYWVQDGATAPTAGIFIYTGADPTVAVGDALDIVGATVGNFYGQIQLTGATVAPVSSGAEVVPVAIDEADIGALVAAKGQAALEGVLVSVSNITITNISPTPGPGDMGEGEVELTGGLRLDNALFAEGAPFLVPAPKNGDVLSAVTGMLVWRNDNLKLLPRSEADLVLGPPALASIGPDGQAQLAGSSGSTFPKPLVVSLTRVTDSPFVVDLESDDEGVAKVPATVTIAAGTSSAEVPVTGVGAGTASITASAGGKAFVADVQIYPEDTVPTPVAIEPGEAVVLAGGTATFTVFLNVPAPAGGVELDVVVTGGVGTAPSSLTIDAGEAQGSFEFSAGENPGFGGVSVSGGNATLSAEVEVIPASSVSIDIGGWKLVQTGADKTFTIPAGTSLSGGGYLVISRDSAQADFEAYWGVTLPANVVFIHSKAKGGEFPSINGDETYQLVDGSGAVVDGPTIPLVEKKAFTRNVPVGAAGDAASWTSGAAKATATPGKGQSLAAAPSGVYISEFADSDGSTGTFAYEFVELHFDGPK